MIIFREIPEQSHSVIHLSWKEFIDDVYSESLTDEDGIGMLATDKEESDITITPGILLDGFVAPNWCTRVVWYFS